MDIHGIWLLGTGFLIGLRHALDADHLVAVSTLISEEGNIRRSSLLGAFWGAGHTAALLCASSIIIYFDLHFPELVSLGFEFLVAIVLIVLGIRVLWKVRRGALLHVHTHVHGGHMHVHPHIHASQGTHQHQSSESHHQLRKQSTSFIVGLIHGLAGTAGLMLLILPAIPSRLLAISYVAIFGIGSVGGMMLMSTMIAVPVSLSIRRAKHINVLRIGAALGSLVLGVLLAVEIGLTAANL